MRKDIASAKKRMSAALLLAFPLWIVCGTTQVAAQAQSTSSAAASASKTPQPATSGLPVNFERHTGDLDAMVKAKNIRALVLYSHSSFFYARRQPTSSSQMFSSHNMQSRLLRPVDSRLFQHLQSKWTLTEKLRSGDYQRDGDFSPMVRQSQVLSGDHDAHAQTTQREMAGTRVGLQVAGEKSLPGPCPCTVPRHSGKAKRCHS